VLLITLVLNLLVAGAKVVYGNMTGTLTIRADGFHSLTDGTNNVLGLLGIWWASRPPDEQHPYGHEKIEVLAAGAIGASLLLVAWNLVRDGVSRLAHPEAPQLDAGAWVVLGLTFLVNIGVWRYEARQAERLHSPFLASDAAHTLSDLAVTAGVALAVGCLQLGWTWVDPIATLLIAGFIVVTGVRVVRGNLGYLLDAAQLDEALVQRIVCQVPGVASAHKIRTRGTPGRVRVDLHIQIAPHLDVRRAHEVTHWAIDAIKRQIDGVRDVVVHTEPAREGAPYPALPQSQVASERSEPNPGP
jgi:cation diffusion facilitator family transporter